MEDVTGGTTLFELCSHVDCGHAACVIVGFRTVTEETGTNYAHGFSCANPIHIADLFTDLGSLAPEMLEDPRGVMERAEQEFKERWHLGAEGE